MANGKAQKTLRKVVEGEHLAANALAVAIGKVKETDLKNLLGNIRDVHEANVEEAGSRLQAAGGKYPIPGLRDQLRKGWESVASTKNSVDALKLLQKKEKQSLIDYKELLKKVTDEQTMSLILRNMAATTENVVKLSESLGQLQGKKKKGRFLGLPRSLWVLGAAGGAGYYFYKRNASQPASPTTPSSDAGSKS
ncbi:MAG TPA: ferritin-like domain-containing protein [Chloroflexia bacterium]|nr:ferritin-like domain-containing protein [Chloroflexia bacterium]